MQAIHECLHEHGPRGKDGIARITKLNSNQVARRLPEMAKLGLVEETGKLVLSDAGRKERQWRGL
jgi:predicted ArsR family transcriptional regulator